jgi:hypothetical protein
VDGVAVEVGTALVSSLRDASREGETGCRLLLGARVVVLLLVDDGFVLAELGKRDGRLVERLILSLEDLLRTTLPDDDTGVSPSEVVEAPEGVDGKEEGVDRVGEL